MPRTTTLRLLRYFGWIASDAFRRFIVDEQKKWADVVVRSGATIN